MILLLNYYQQKLLERKIKFELNQKIVLQLSDTIPIHRYIRTFKNFLLNCPHQF